MTEDNQDIASAGDKEESYLSDLLTQVGYKHYDSAKMTFIDADGVSAYCVYEFLGLEK